MATSDWSQDLEQSQARGLAILASAELALAWLMVVPYLVEDEYRALAWAIVALLASGVGALVMVGRHFRLAALWFLALTTTAVTIGAVALPGAFTFGLFALVVMVGGAFLGPRWATGVALLATAILMGAVEASGGQMVWEAVSAGTLVWGASLLSWITVRPLQHALAWAMHGHNEARQRTAEAERHRGELGLTVKSLRETHERLERVTAELERARAAAENARTLKARFAAYISHELRTPLNLIIGFTDMMVKAPHTYGGEILPPAYRGDVDAIYQSARHLASLVDDVLDLSQIDAHRMALDRDDVALIDVVGGSVETMRAAYAEKGLWLHTDIPVDLPMLYIDRTRIRQVLINLLGNALRYTEQGGVTISAIRQGSEAIIRVTDTGVGIPPHDLPRLFEEFQQAESADGDRPEGSGLGLAIARRFVTVHGGWMRIESDLGQGTTFEFALPIHGILSDEGADADTDDRQALSASHRPTVGVLGGDPLLLRLATRYLDGYRVVSLGSPRRHDWRRRIDGLVAVLVSATDTRDPWARAQSLLAVTGGVPVICCSFRGARDAMARHGVADYLSKPISRELLERALRHALRGRESPTILIVDDDPHMVRLLSRMVQTASRNVRILQATDGAVALQIMRQTPPDVVLLDLLMPHVDGYDVLETMRREDGLRDVPVVVITARGTDGDVVTSGVFAVARSGEISAGEVMRNLQATLDQLNPPLAVQVRPVPVSGPHV